MIARRFLDRVDNILRGGSSSPWGVAIVCALLYGAVMGSFGGVTGERTWQVVYSSVKVPLLLGATVALAMPSFVVINALAGVRDDLGLAIRAIVVSQATLAVLLASLAPITLFWYASATDYTTAILFNGLMFGIASFGAQATLRRLYSPLIARDPRHRGPLRAWVILYAFVGIQMGWTLRPFLGDENQPLEFFRGGELENAYVIVARMIFRVIGGSMRVELP